MRLRRLLPLLLILGSACGPTAGLLFGESEIPADIVLGLQQQSKQAVQRFLEGPVIPVYVPTFPTLPSPVPAPAACPAAPVFAVPDIPASPDLEGQPGAGVYGERWQGAFQPDVTAKGIISFPATSLAALKQGSTNLPQGIYTYSVTDTVGGPDGTYRVATSFEVVPQNVTESAPGGQVVTEAAGIFVTGIVMTPPKGAPTIFNPATPVTYLNLPVAPGNSWSTAGYDPATQTTLTLSGAVNDSTDAPGGRHRVDACGTVLDSWQVEATGTLVSPSQNLTVDWVYDVATQYGGLTLRQVLKLSGNFNGLTGAMGLSHSEEVIDSVTPTAP